MKNTDYDYRPIFLVGKTIEELEQMKQDAIDDQYYFGIVVDKALMWDIEYTIRELKKCQ